jgi:hypothetical protein
MLRGGWCVIRTTLGAENEQVQPLPQVLMPARRRDRRHLHSGWTGKTDPQVRTVFAEPGFTFPAGSLLREDGRFRPEIWLLAVPNG